jgi:hypothetical protein
MTAAHMNVRVYKLINRSECQALASRLRPIAESWVEAFAATKVKTALQVHAGIDDVATRAAGCEWMIGKGEEGPALALGLPNGWPQGLARHLLAGRAAALLDAAGSQLMRQMGTRVLQDLCQKFYDVVRQAGTRAKPLDWALQKELPVLGGRPGDPAATCECLLGNDFMLYVVLWPATVMYSLAPHAPATASQRVTPVSRALERQVVRLDALAGEAEIAFQELATLAPGDVLKLDRRLSEPVEVRVQSGGPVCRARLGISRGRLALRLTQQ